VNYYFAAFKKYGVFKGRATRSEYWYFTLFNILAVGLFGLIDQLMGTFNFDAGYGPLSAIYTLAMILPGLGVSIRRLHGKCQHCFDPPTFTTTTVYDENIELWCLKAPYPL
jgi:uncharacterized membrane protein YhaH (DUF805 family)